MRTLKRIAPITICVLGLGCTDQSGHRDPFAPHLAVAGRSGCYTVQFNVAFVPTGALGGQGVLTGDVNGTVGIQFEAASIQFAGATFSNSGTATWSITSGIIPGPLTFLTVFENMNVLIDRPGSPPTLFENIGRHRAVTGVETANLHYTGTFTLVPSPLGDHDYQGVICP
jgi:hypothetical protein